MTNKQRKWQLKKIESGLCSICGKAAATHKGYCDIHYAAVLERTRIWYWEHGGKERKSKYMYKRNHPSEQLVSVPGGQEEEDGR